MIDAISLCFFVGELLCCAPVVAAQSVPCGSPPGRACPSSGWSCEEQDSGYCCPDGMRFGFSQTDQQWACVVNASDQTCSPSSSCAAADSSPLPAESDEENFRACGSHDAGCCGDVCCQAPPFSGGPFCCGNGTCPATYHGFILDGCDNFTGGVAQPQAGCYSVAPPPVLPCGSDSYCPVDTTCCSAEAGSCCPTNSKCEALDPSMPLNFSCVLTTSSLCTGFPCDAKCAKFGHTCCRTICCAAKCCSNSTLPLICPAGFECFNSALALCAQPAVPQLNWSQYPDSAIFGRRLA